MASIVDLPSAKRMMHYQIGNAVQELERMKAFVEKESVVGIRTRLAEVHLMLMTVASEATRMEEALESHRAAQARMEFSVRMAQAGEAMKSTDEGGLS